MLPVLEPALTLQLIVRLTKIIMNAGGFLTTLKIANIVSLNPRLYILSLTSQIFKDNKSLIRPAKQPNPKKRKVRQSGGARRRGAYAQYS